MEDSEKMTLLNTQMPTPTVPQSVAMTGTEFVYSQGFDGQSTTMAEHSEIDYSDVIKTPSLSPDHCGQSPRSIKEEFKQSHCVEESPNNRRLFGGKNRCVVCGDKASGFHYNALTCEGCKEHVSRGNSNSSGNPNYSYVQVASPLRNNQNLPPSRKTKREYTSDDEGDDLETINSPETPPATGEMPTLITADSVIGPFDERATVRRRRHGVKASENDLCLICGDRASGYHYNALSCEGCKGFFRRSITKNSVYKCTRGNKCEMDMYMRRKCQECRLKKCREVGMLPECLLTPDQCRSKRQRKMLKSHSTSTSSVSSASPDSIQMSPGNPVSPEAISYVSPTAKSDIPSFKILDSFSSYMNEKQAKLIRNLLDAKRIYSWPAPKNIARVTPWPGVTGDSSLLQLAEEEQKKMMLAHMIEITILCIQSIIEFAKNIPGFSQINRSDQITLVKASAIEVLMLQSAQRFDYKDESLIMATGFKFSRNELSRGGLSEFVDPIIDFSKSMAELSLDETEYAILTALCILAPDRQNLEDRQFIEVIQEPYLDILRVYLKFNRPKENLILPKMLMKLTELRTVNCQHSEYLFQLKLQQQNLPPLLVELWDQ